MVNPRFADSELETAIAGVDGGRVHGWRMFAF
jgi:hypothetical protein